MVARSASVPARCCEQRGEFSGDVDGEAVSVVGERDERAAQIGGVTVASDQPALVEDRDGVTDGGLGHVEFGREVTDAAWPAVGERLDHAQAEQRHLVARRDVLARGAQRPTESFDRGEHLAVEVGAVAHDPIVACAAARRVTSGSGRRAGTTTRRSG